MSAEVGPAAGEVKEEEEDDPEFESCHGGGSFTASLPALESLRQWAASSSKVVVEDAAPASGLTKRELSRGSSYRCRSLEWRIEEYAINTGAKRRVILQDIAGHADGGSFVGILGPSGCGKTSMIDCLALRQPSFKGAIYLDDHPIRSDYFYHTAYVHQECLFMSHLTCREHVTFQAMCRKRRKDMVVDRMTRVHEVLEEVDLLGVADSQIGGGTHFLVKGLSGGEQKRLSIATELLSDPAILLLDEPTSGLDAVMGEWVCALLLDLAGGRVASPAAAAPPPPSSSSPSPSPVPSSWSSGRLVMAAVHSPSSKVFRMLSHVLVLTSMGRLAYYGPTDELLPYLSGLGLECPVNFNPADFVLELASAKVMDRSGGPKREDLPGGCLVESKVHERLVEAYATHVAPHFKRLPTTAHQAWVGVRGRGGRTLLHWRMNVWRSWIQESREVSVLVVNVVMNAMQGVLYGVVYLHNVDGNVRNTMGFLFALAVKVIITCTVSVVLYTPQDFRIVLREYYSGCNSAVPYFLGRSLSSIPFSLVYMGMAVVPYYMTGLAQQPAAFARFCLTTLLLIFGSQSVGYLASAFSTSTNVGLAIVPVVMLLMVLFSGFLFQRDTVPPYFTWVQEASLVNHAFGLYVLNEARHVSDDAVASKLLQVVQLHDSPHAMSSRFGVLLGLGLAYRLLAMLVLMARLRTARSD